MFMGCDIFLRRKRLEGQIVQLAGFDNYPSSCATAHTMTPSEKDQGKRTGGYASQVLCCRYTIGDCIPRIVGETLGLVHNP